MTRVKCYIPILLLAVATAAWATVADNGVVDRLKYDVYFLASDALEGRRAGSPGAAVAARFIAERFRALGLAPAGADGGYLQPLTFVASVTPGPGNRLRLRLPSGERVAAVGAEFTPLPFSAAGSASGEVVFAGYGISASAEGWDDYAGLDVKGKVVLVLRFSPHGDNPASKLQPHMALRRKAAEARERGAVAVLVATGPVESKDDAPVKISFDASFGDAGLPVLGMATPLAESLFAGQGFTLAELQRRMNERFEPASRPLAVHAELTADVIPQRATTENVVALLPGRDPARAHEVVVVGAHYDHLGWGGEGSGSLQPQDHAIHNGADDNASGVAGLLEMARSLAAAPPARSVLFAAFAAEEVGLLGSSYLVQNFPLPRERVVAMLNLDMIGRPKAGPKLTVSGVGTAAQWPELVTARNGNHGLTIATDQGGFGASDHSSFYAAGIPVLFFFTGAHEDYHRPSDDAHRLDYQGMAQVVAFGADLVRAIADLPERPTFQRVAETGPGGRRNLKVRTGVIPEFGWEGEGFKISGVAGGSPAERAGLQAGDVVLRFGARQVRNIYDYMYALGDHQPGEEVELLIRRGGETLTVSVTLEPGGGGRR